MTALAPNHQRFTGALEPGDPWVAGPLRVRVIAVESGLGTKPARGEAVEGRRLAECG
ncbi:hypothetical protein GCM10023336_04860 [Streptomyces similanensis]|uniref:Uncharacterized protein n=1 Tax=Streptomyces similanensis TaxID=1274988 RepID=A0ABP9JTT2_9ACTN